MGTRSTITFKKDGKPICKIYQQFDGYLEGVGVELKDFLKSREFVNGFSDTNVFNGAGCCIAQYIAEHKNGAGNLYMTSFDDVEEYNYTINFLHNEETYVVDRVECSVTDWELKEIEEWAETLICGKALKKKTRKKKEKV